MSFRAWGPKGNKAYALTVAATQTNAIQPVGFANGGNQVKILNTGTVPVLVAFWKHADGDPSLTFPVTGAPPVGQGGGSPVDGTVCVTVVGAGLEKQISIPLGCDSFGNIGSAAGTTIIVQRGDGSV